MKNLEKPKVDVMGYEVLERVMAEASLHLNQEILEMLRDKGGKKDSAPYHPPRAVAI